MFSGTDDMDIYGGVFTVNQHLHIHQYGLAVEGNPLISYVAVAAFHNSEARYDPPKCHQGTRVELLKRVVGWVRGEIDYDKPIMWIYGAAGTGKSAIEQTICELCAIRTPSLCLSSFFFSRHDGSRSHSRAFVATIAYQMTVACPALKTHVKVAIERDPLIFSRSLEAQMAALIIEPLQRLVTQNGFSKCFLIVVDGLDECMDGTRIQLVECLSKVVKSFQEHRMVIVSFASRPEHDLRNYFAYSFDAHILSRVALDDDYRSDKDIHLFLSDVFASIRQSRPQIPFDWPSEEQVKVLVKKASGQFIYASTAHKFVSSVHHNPIKRLEIILGLSPGRGTTPFSELDAVYRQILQSVPKDCVDEGVDTIAILYAMTTTPTGPAVTTIATISEIMSCDVLDLRFLLENYSSIVSIVDEKYPKILHASLGDFLFDENRSKDLYRNPLLQHEFIFRRLVELLVAPWDEGIPHSLEYSFSGLFTHVISPVAGSPLLKSLQQLFSTSFVTNVATAWSNMMPTQRICATLIHIFTQSLSIVVKIPPGESATETRQLLYAAANELMIALLRQSQPLIQSLLRLFCTPNFRDDFSGIRDGGNLRSRILTLFPPRLDCYWIDLFQSWVLPVFFGNPLKSGMDHSLRPQDFDQLTTQFLGHLIRPLSRRRFDHSKWFVKAGIWSPSYYQLPVTSLSSDSLKPLNLHDYLAILYRFLPPEDGYVIPPIQKKETESLQNQAMFFNGIYAALTLLPFMIRNSPSSFRVLKLCRKPNLKRFPWILMPKQARKVAKEMAQYRRRFTIGWVVIRQA